MVEGRWDAAAGQDAASGGFDILELHRGRQQDFSFLPPLAKQVRNLWINCESDSSAGLEQLAELETLTLSYPLRKPFDFGHLKGLHSLRVDAWQPWYAESLFSHPTLRALHIEGYDGSDAAGPAALRSLESLGLTKGRLQDLSPLSNHGSLRELGLSHLKLLDRLDAVAALPRLEHLSLGEALPAVTNLTPVYGCRGLRSLALVGTRAEVPQTRWLRDFGRLRDLRLQCGVQQFDWPDLLASRDLKKLAVVFSAPLSFSDDDIRGQATTAGLSVRELVRFGTKKRPALLIEFA